MKLRETLRFALKWAHSINEHMISYNFLHDGRRPSILMAMTIMNLYDAVKEIPQDQIDKLPLHIAETVYKIQNSVNPISESLKDEDDFIPPSNQDKIERIRDNLEDSIDFYEILTKNLSKSLSTLRHDILKIDYNASILER